MSKKMLRDAIENPLEQVKGSSSNLLGRVYWTLVKELGITFNSFSASLNRYVEDSSNVYPQTSSKRSEKISNLTAELTSLERMSWNKLIEGLKAIEIVRIRIKFEVWRGRRGVYACAVLDTTLCDVDTKDSQDTDETDGTDTKENNNGQS